MDAHEFRNLPFMYLPSLYFRYARNMHTSFEQQVYRFRLLIIPSTIVSSFRVPGPTSRLPSGP